jgi:hypothetical protein
VSIRAVKIAASSDFLQGGAVIAQPLLYVPPEIELRILTGELARRGSVVREVANGASSST